MIKKNALYKSINRSVGKAIHKYDMISDGDGIVVGVSGGKDSLTLLRLLSDRIAWAPVTYTLYPVFIDPGFENGFGGALASYCRGKGWNLRVVETQIGVTAHESGNKQNPCFTCSRQRRQLLFDIADEYGVRKIALGHNQDDLIETLFLNMFQAGQISTMLPNQPIFGGKLKIIRPLAHVDEDHIRRFARENGFPCYPNPCPSASNSMRKEMKDFLSAAYGMDRSVKANIFRSMSNVRMDYMLK